MKSILPFYNDNAKNLNLLDGLRLVLGRGCHVCVSKLIKNWERHNPVCHIWRCPHWLRLNQDWLKGYHVLDLSLSTLKLSTISISISWLGHSVYSFVSVFLLFVKQNRIALHTTTVTLWAHLFHFQIFKLPFPNISYIYVNIAHNGKKMILLFIIVH